MSAAFDDLSVCFGFTTPATVSRKVKAKVIRRIGPVQTATAADFERELIRALLAANNKRRSHACRERFKADAARLRKAARAEQELLVRSLDAPVSRLAAQPEHAVVLWQLGAAAFAKSPEWRRTRVDALRLAGYRCQWCGATAATAQLEVDHIMPRIAAPELSFDISNLRVLCQPCHAGRHASDRI